MSNSESSIELFNHRVKFVSNSEKQTTATRRNVESDCAIVYEMSVSNAKRDQTLKLFPSGESTSTFKASKSSTLRKKLQAEKLALELKIAEQKCEEEIRLLRAEADELLELKRRAEETKLEVAYEGAFAIENSNHGDIDDKNLAGLPVDSVEDRVSRLHLNSASNTQTVVNW